MVTIAFSFPQELSRVPRVRAVLMDVGEFIRDLWLARAPYATGGYAKGLLNAGAIKLNGNKLEITNRAQHAAIVEYGFRSYNIGLAMLNKGKGVRTSAEGYRYKVVKIEKGPETKHRQPSVGQAVQKGFAKLAPIGIRPNPGNKFGRYEPRKSLRKPLKPGRTKNSGVFVISEKAIKQNPQKWMMPAREGRRLAESIQKEGAPIIRDVVRRVIAQEKDRQTRLQGEKPRWFKPSMARAPLKQEPVSGGRKK